MKDGPVTETTEGLVRRWSVWPGFRLVTYSQVGLPVYRLTITAITIERRTLDVIVEFLLRTVAAGVNSEVEIAAFLGIETDLVQAQVADLLREGLLTLEAAGGEEQRRPLGLTRRGREVLESKMSARPVDQTLITYFDGLLREPRPFGAYDLFKPKDLRALGAPEIALSKSRRPRPDEVDPERLESSLALGRRRSRGELAPKVLRVSSVDRAESMYRLAVVLVFRAEVGGELRLRTVIDGRLSEEHAKRLLDGGVLEKSPSFQQLGHLEPVPKDLAGVVGPAFAELVSRAATATPPVHDPPSESGRAEVERESPPSALPSARPLSVYEHPELLERALLEAREKLVIVSPWIRAAVVDHRFLSRLSACLRRGTKVIIGYGFGEDRGARFEDRKALERLAELQREGLVLRQLGDNHAKVLIVDHDYYVISSFNWLSFRGGRGAAFREEWGVFVPGAAAVSDLYERLGPRLEPGPQ